MNKFFTKLASSLLLSALVVSAVPVRASSIQGIEGQIKDFTGDDFVVDYRIKDSGGKVQLELTVNPDTNWGDINSIQLAIPATLIENLAISDVKWLDLNETDATTASPLTDIPSASLGFLIETSGEFNLSGGSTGNPCNSAEVVCNTQITFGSAGASTDYVHGVSFTLETLSGQALKASDFIALTLRATSVGSNGNYEGSTKTGVFLFGYEGTSANDGTGSTANLIPYFAD